MSNIPTAEEFIINKEFVPYEQALDLAKGNFNGKCFGYYDLESEVHIEISCNLDTNLTRRNFIAAPTFSQAFRWFRVKYGLDCSFEDDIVEDDSNEEIQMCDFFIFKTKQKSDNKVMTFCSNNFDTYIESYSREEAELECLKKLIEIVKE